MPEADLATRQDRLKEAALDKAAALAREGRLAEARAAALPLLGVPALHAKALLLLTDIHLRANDPAGALPFTDRAARLAPGSLRARALNATCLARAGLAEAALAEGQAALAIDPEDKEAAAAYALAAGRPPAEAEATPAPGHPVGEVGLTPGGGVEGFVYDPLRPGERLRAVLEDEAGQRLVVKADAFRQDLLLRGVHDGRHGFTAAWPFAGQPAVVRVRAMEFKTGRELSGSPLLVPNPGLAAAGLARLAAWLRRAGAEGQAPEPLPPQCRGLLLDFARNALAKAAAELEAAAADKDAADAAD